MTITALPTPPTRSDPTNFASRADTFLAAMPMFADEANALASAMNLNSTTDTSTTSNSIGTGTKTFSVSTGKSFVGGMYILIADTAAPTTNAMIGQVSSYSGSTLVVSVKYTIGSGTKTAWTISQSVPYAEHIDGVPIGATTPSTGAFTTLSSSGGITNTASGGNSTLTLSGTGTYSSVITLNGSGGGSGYITSAGGQLRLNAPTGQTLTTEINNSAITTTSSAGLAVTGTLNSTSDLSVLQRAPRLLLKDTDVNGYNWALVANNSAFGDLVLRRSNATQGDPIGAGTAVLSLDASGSWLVNCTTVGNLNSNSTNFATSSGTQAVNHISGTGSGTSYVTFGYNATQIGSITQNGTTAVAFNTTSDHRLKTNVRPADAKSFKDIRFVDFEWVDGRHDCGVIAHELQAIYPDLVVGEKDTTETRQVQVGTRKVTKTRQATDKTIVNEEKVVLIDGVHVLRMFEKVVEQPLAEHLPVFNADGTPAMVEVPEVLDDDGNVVTPARSVQRTVTVPVMEEYEEDEPVFEDQTFDKHQQVNYLGLIPRMGTVIQKLMAQVEALEARIAVLEAK